MSAKNPIFLSAKVPTTVPLSRSLLPISQQVSGNSVQLWQAAKFNDSGPYPAD